MMNFVTIDANSCKVCQIEQRTLRTLYSIIASPKCYQNIEYVWKWLVQLRWWTWKRIFSPKNESLSDDERKCIFSSDWLPKKTMMQLKRHNPENSLQSYPSITADIIGCNDAVDVFVVVPNSLISTWAAGVSNLSCGTST